MAEDWARPFVHWELRAKDPEKQRAFYAAMFNWEIGDGPIMNIPAGVGGPDPDGLSGHIITNERPGFVPFFQVLDLRASLDKAERLGGAVTLQPIEVPRGDGTTIGVAGITDPEGNPVTLVQQ